MKIQLLNDINCVYQGIDGIGGIYISDIRGAKNLSVLKKYNIKAVLCAARSGFVEYDKQIIQDYLYIPADDYEQFNLLQYFEKAYEFIDKNRKKTNILVHCMAGISRSATLVIAYLIKKHRYSVQSILSLLKRKRSIISPNQGFLQQLKSFQNMNRINQDSHQTIRQHRRIYSTLNRQSSFSNRYQSKIFQGQAASSSISPKCRGLSSQLKKNMVKQIKIQNSATLKRNFYNFQDLTTNQSKQNRQSLIKPEFYSSELSGINILSIIQVQQEASELKLQSILSIPTSFKQEQNTKQYSPQPLSLNPQTNQQPLSIFSPKLVPSLKERIESLKNNLLKEYKRKESNDYLKDIENKQEKQIDLALAIKILKGTKPRRHLQKTLYKESLKIQ